MSDQNNPGKTPEDEQKPQDQPTDDQGNATGTGQDSDDVGSDAIGAGGSGGA